VRGRRGAEAERSDGHAGGTSGVMLGDAKACAPRDSGEESPGPFRQEGVDGEEGQKGARRPLAARKGLSGGLLSVAERAGGRRAGESRMVLQFLRMSSRRVLARLRMSCDDCDWSIEV
jgi:hypothetical protein